MEGTADDGIDAGLAAADPQVIDHAARSMREREGHLAFRRGSDRRDDYARRAHARAESRRSDSRATGIGLGDRVATLAWNTARHLEAWYGITGIGAIYHTVNPRLFADQIA